MNVVVGSSIARDLAKYSLLRQNPSVEVWSQPGAKYDDIRSSKSGSHDDYSDSEGESFA